MSALASAPDTSWDTQSACLEVDPDEMFPDTALYDHPLWQRAREVCVGCPVLETCREENLTQPHGMFGGLDPEQRKALRRRRARALRLQTASAKDAAGAGEDDTDSVDDETDQQLAG